MRSEINTPLTLLAALLSMLGPFTIDTYLPSFPDIATEFAISRSLLSQSLGVYLVTFAVSMLMWGPLADHIGRKPVLIISLLLYIMASIACAITNNIESFLLFRSLQGVAASGSFVASRAMIRDVHDSQTAQQAMSRIMMMFALAPAIAPLLGGWLQLQFGWRSIFLSLTSFAMLLLLLVLLMRETLPIASRQPLHPLAIWHTYKQRAGDRLFMALVSSIALSFAGLFMYISGAPVIIYDFLELGVSDFGYLFIPIVTGMVLGSALASRQAHRWRPRQMITLGFSLMVLASLLNLLQALFGAATVVVIITPMVLYAFGLSLTMPALTILALDRCPTHRGSATSMQGFIQMVLNAAVASIAVPLLQTERLHFVLGQVAFLVAAVVLWWSVAHSKPPQKQVVK
ncbi:MAG: multidrug effflux MFS transporter [Mariprofundales bacterium]|nr:multidrug effflux MFS transporter [Mariprofundales bacterium]